jgi:hypothetical protein
MQRKLIWMLAVGGVTACAALYVGRIQATSVSGFSGTTLAVGRFDDIDASNHVFQDGLPHSRSKKNLWLSFQKTKGPSDLYVQNNVWTAGGTTGWHTHPGHSLIIVTAGAVTVYDGHDESCTPHVYTPGMGFVDAGGDHVHVIRNEGAVEARTVAVQLIPAGATRRIDADGPSSCPF